MGARGSGPGSSVAYWRFVRGTVVAVGDWADDDSLYFGAPDPAIGTLKRAEVLHNAGSDYAIAVGWIDADGRRHMNFADQDEVDPNTLAIWLREAPSDDIVVIVVAP
jgi:hypothetical protein